MALFRNIVKLSKPIISSRAHTYPPSLVRSGSGLRWLSLPPPPPGSSNPFPTSEDRVSRFEIGLSRVQSGNVKVQAGLARLEATIVERFGKLEGTVDERLKKIEGIVAERFGDLKSELNKVETVVTDAHKEAEARRKLDAFLNALEKIRDFILRHPETFAGFIGSLLVLLKAYWVSLCARAHDIVAAWSSLDASVIFMCGIVIAYALFIAYVFSL